MTDVSSITLCKLPSSLKINCCRNPIKGVYLPTLNFYRLLLCFFKVHVLARRVGGGDEVGQWGVSFFV